MSTNIRWSSEYRIDNAIIDSQHQWLFELAERLLESDRLPLDSEEISPVVLNLYRYMESHFEREERLAKQVGYPGYDAQVNAHQMIVDRMNAMMKSCKTFEELRPKLHEIFSQWIEQHILVMDKDLALFIKNKHSLE